MTEQKIKMRRRPSSVRLPLLDEMASMSATLTVYEAENDHRKAVTELNRILEQVQAMDGAVSYHTKYVWMIDNGWSDTATSFWDTRNRLFNVRAEAHRCVLCSDLLGECSYCHTIRSPVFREMECFQNHIFCSKRCKKRYKRKSTRYYIDNHPPGELNFPTPPIGSKMLRWAHGTIEGKRTKLYL